MKLYIDTTLSKKFKINRDELSEITETLKKFSIRNHIEGIGEDLFNIKILDQKVTLDEISMNILFDNILNYFDFRMEYGNYGGERCEFSIRIYTEYKENQCTK